MRVQPWVKRLFTVNESGMGERFTLQPGTKYGRDNDEETGAPNPVLEKEGPPVAVGQKLTRHLDEAKEILTKTFHLPQNKDIYLREFHVGVNGEWRAIAAFVDGMADKNIINAHILEPLMLLAHLGATDKTSGRAELIEKTLIPGNQVQPVEQWSDAIQGILAGSTAVFVDGCDTAFVVETKGWEHRTVGLAQTETVVRGPKDAFTESFRANTGLVRARLRSEHLVTEVFSVGKLGRTDVAVMYMQGLTNPQIVEEVKRRIKAVDVDFLPDSGLLEQFIEDDPYMLVPQVLSTERPDRVTSMLVEGYVAIFVGNSPFALVVPVVFYSLMQTAEDAYIRHPYGTFLRSIRWLALVVALLLPSLYISVTNYHPEMIPTDLMLAIAGSREQVPFPAIIEIILMEFSIELIREAGIRVPTVIGPTIGIVGALIIGQAAVQAGVVSPLLVIIVATTALASFAIPNYNLNLGVRIMRFVFLAVGAMFGFYAIALLLVVLLVRLSIQKSFGVPLLAPIAPAMDTSPDVIRRGPVFAMNERPSFLQTLQDWRQQPITRPWSVTTDKKTRRLGRKRGKP